MLKCPDHNYLVNGNECYECQFKGSFSCDLNGATECVPQHILIERNCYNCEDEYEGRSVCDEDGTLQCPDGFLYRSQNKCSLEPDYGD